MSLRTRLIAAVAGLCMGFSGAAFAVAGPPPVDLTITNASGLPGSLVSPMISFDIDGFVYTSFNLTFSYKDSALTFLPGASTVSYNSTSGPFLSSLPAVTTGPKLVANDVATVTFGSLTLDTFPVNTPLLLTAVFQFKNAVPAGPYDISFSGTVSEDLVYEERGFSGLATVTAVPEPEVWMLLLGGLGLLAWKKRSRILK